ncbi:thiol-disulfide oxidoreductase DCC family protein [Nakamurella deserti]|uniref:thiol-disulfide oxidoreductase DCC family protein n=1 Tax=Nakamurella deserti TaxID=2164074 RepID=UPI000DBE1BA5|nr:DUF393 domain-containing protein [Nakamurella deserti]
MSPAPPTTPAIPATSDVTVYYDADCGFCIWAVALLLRFDRGRRLDVATIQGAVDGPLARVPRDRVMESFHTVSRSGGLASAGAALTVTLRALPALRWAGALSGRVPRLTGWAYRWIADHRGRLATLVPERAKARARVVVAARRVDVPPAGPTGPAA